MLIVLIVLSVFVRAVLVLAFYGVYNLLTTPFVNGDILLKHLMTSLTMSVLMIIAWILFLKL